MMRRPLRASLLLSAALLGLVLAGPATAAAGRWLHVRVHEGADETVALNVPFAVAEKLLDLVPRGEIDRAVKDALGPHRSLDDFRELWRELAAVEDAELLRLESGESSVLVAREGELVRIRVLEGEAAKQAVSVDLPVAVMDAVLAGSGDRLDLGAALKRLKESDVSELVRVDDGASRVRIWVE